MVRRVGTVVGVARTKVKGFGPLRAIDRDVEIFEEVFRPAYDLTVLREPDAELNAVHDEIIRWHSVLRPGDTFLFAFSGHGSQRRNGGSTKESLILADKPYPDVTLRSALHGFDPGVWVVALIDACHAAGTTFLVPPDRAVHGTVWQRDQRIPGARSLTLAAAPEDALANQDPEGGGQLTRCLRQAHLEGDTKGDWRRLWDSVSAWAIGYEQDPLPQAWLDGPEGTRDEILNVSVF